MYNKHAASQAWMKKGEKLYYMYSDTKLNSMF